MIYQLSHNLKKMCKPELGQAKDKYINVNWLENRCILLEDKARGGGKAERTRGGK